MSYFLNTKRTTDLFIMGYECNYTAPTWQVENEAWHLNSNYIGGSFNCDFNGTQGAVAYEQNFGFSRITSERRNFDALPMSVPPHNSGLEVK